jgi:hypothetical protein
MVFQPTHKITQEDYDDAMLRSETSGAYERPAVEATGPDTTYSATIGKQAVVPSVADSSVTLRYTESTPILARSPITGRQYQFSPSSPVQAVDARDAVALLRTGFFHCVRAHVEEGS